MDCPICGHTNRADAKFCSNCGNPLQLVCPICSHVSAVDANFCSNCGHRFAMGPREIAGYVPPETLAKINQARADQRMRGERRTVTMLFADIQGSTAAAEGLDPEEWTEIVNGAFEHLIRPVYRYEGTLARLLGDAVLAFFGAPIAHEDDPVRAVRAGLEITEAMRTYAEQVADRWGLSIGVRVGINTGLVVVGEVGSDLRVDYTAIGDAVNVAARMEQTAEPGTVRVTEETWDLVYNHFDGEEIGPVDVKGKSEPVVAYRVRGVRTAGVVEDDLSPLVGRGEELSRLEELAKSLNEGPGWVASIVGDAGVGKSRLLQEFYRTVSASGVACSHAEHGELGWMTASIESYDSQIPYSAARQLFGRWWDLENADDPYATVAAAAELVPDVADAAAYLGAFTRVDLPSDVVSFLDELEPPALDSRVRHAVLSYLRAEARRRPFVVAVEDLHWADAMSLALIEQVMDVTESEPLGLLLTMRPNRDEAAWHLHEVAEREHPHRYTPIELEALSEAEAAALLDSLVGVDLPPERRRSILDRSGGNPLFIEEIAWAIQEGNGQDVPVPSGLSSLLTARLDRLDPASRIVAQYASVVGNEFDRATVAAVLGEPPDLAHRLTDLLRRGIFVERSGSTLAFSHALMRETAYSTLLLRTRRDLHRRLAEHLATARPQAVTQIALHYTEADDMAAAFPFLVAAGERASRAMALSDAIRWFTRALENIPADADPSLVVRAYDGLGVAYTLLPDLTKSESIFQRLVEYAENSGRPSAKVTALNRLAMSAAMLGGDLAAAHRYLDDAFAAAQEAEDEFGLAEYHMIACTVAAMGGDLDASLAHNDQIARWGEALGAARIRSEGLTRMAINRAWLMDFDRIGPTTEEAIAAAREADDERNLAVLDAMVEYRVQLREGDIAGALDAMVRSEETLTRYDEFLLPLVLVSAATLLWCRGEVDPAVERLERAREMAASRGMTYFTAAACATLSWIYATLGMRSEADAIRRQAVVDVRARLGDFVASTVWADLGAAALAMGDLGGAAEAFEEGLRSSSATKYWETPRHLVGRALVHAARGEAEAAHASLDEAEAFLSAKQVRAFDAHLAHGRAEALLAEGRLDEAADRYAEAIDEAEAAGWRVFAVQVAAAAARLAEKRGDTAGASRYLDRVRREVDAMAVSVADPEMREAMRTALAGPLVTS